MAKKPFPPKKGAAPAPAPGFPPYNKSSTPKPAAFGKKKKV